MSKPLAYISDDTKEKLKLLGKRFDVDWPEAVISTGDEAIVKIDASVALSAAALQSAITGAADMARQNVIKPAEVIRCRFKTDDHVLIAGHRHTAGFTVREVNKRPYGRTGFWCKLKYYGTDIFYERGEVESAKLEFAPELS
jgi:hypothetical protein